MHTPLKCGCAQIDVTPPVGVELSGYLARIQPSVGVYDRLYVRSIVLELDAQRAVLTGCDILGFPDELARDLRAEISQLAKTKAEHVMLWGTHTHSGPAVAHLNNCGKPDPAYVDFLRSKVIESAREALQRQRPCSAAWAQSAYDIAINRRVQWGSAKEAPPPPTDLSLLSFRDAESDDILAILMHYACHCVVLGSENRVISADLAGAVSNALSHLLPGRPLVLYANGACGDLNPKMRSSDFKILSDAGAQMARTAAEALAKSVPLTLDRISGKMSYVALPTYDMTNDELERIAKQCRHDQAIAAAEGDVFKARMFEAHAMWAEGLLSKAKSGNYPTTINLIIHRLDIGPVCLLGLNVEPLSHYAYLLKAASGPRSLLVGYCDGLFGYLPSPQAMAEGGYEVNDAHKYYGQPPLHSDAPKIAEESIRRIIVEELPDAVA